MALCTHLGNRRDVVAIFIDMDSACLAEEISSSVTPEGIAASVIPSSATRWSIMRRALKSFVLQKKTLAPDYHTQLYFALYLVWEEVVELLPPSPAGSGGIEAAINQYLKQNLSGDTKDAAAGPHVVKPEAAPSPSLQGVSVGNADPSAPTREICAARSLSTNTAGSNDANKGSLQDGNDVTTTATTTGKSEPKLTDEAEAELPKSSFPLSAVCETLRYLSEVMGQVPAVPTANNLGRRKDTRTPIVARVVSGATPKNPLPFNAPPSHPLAAGANQNIPSPASPAKPIPSSVTHVQGVVLLCRGSTALAPAPNQTATVSNSNKNSICSLDIVTLCPCSKKEKASTKHRVGSSSSTNAPLLSALAHDAFNEEQNFAQACAPYGIPCRVVDPIRFTGVSNPILAIGCAMTGLVPFRTITSSTKASKRLEASCISLGLWEAASADAASIDEKKAKAKERKYSATPPMDESSSLNEFDAFGARQSSVATVNLSDSGPTRTLKSTEATDLYPVHRTSIFSASTAPSPQQLVPPAATRAYTGRIVTHPTAAEAFQGKSDAKGDTLPTSNSTTSITATVISPGTTPRTRVGAGEKLEGVHVGTVVDNSTQALFTGSRKYTSNTTPVSDSSIPAAQVLRTTSTSTTPRPSEGPDTSAAGSKSTVTSTTQSTATLDPRAPVASSSSSSQALEGKLNVFSGAADKHRKLLDDNIDKSLSRITSGTRSHAPSYTQNQYKLGVEKDTEVKSSIPYTTNSDIYKKSRDEKSSNPTAATASSTSPQGSSGVGEKRPSYVHQQSWTSPKTSNDDLKARRQRSVTQETLAYDAPSDRRGRSSVGSQDLGANPVLQHRLSDTSEAGLARQNSSGPGGLQPTTSAPSVLTSGQSIPLPTTHSPYTKTPAKGSSRNPPTL